ncbi:hypothetical protein ACTWLT_27105 [Micromonospora sp. ZYX-F-536]|uniref:hypothetical protein n=1 Tax=Micromonospora sp. ZYX-F-536 TaxID=3457629 RepID=UPI00404094B6
MRGRLTYYGALAGLLLGVVGTVAGAASWSWAYLAGLLGFALSLALFLPEWVKLRRPEIALVPGNPPPRNPGGITDGTVVRLPGANEIAVAWDDLDVALMRSAATYGFTPVRRRLPRRVGRFAYAILIAISSSKHIYNGKLVRQDEDLTLDIVVNGGSLSLSLTDYFSTVCSNYLTGRRVIDRRTGATLVEGTDLFIRDGDLLPLDENNQANVIGVSTLALTTDGKLVLTTQGSQTPSSAGLSAPGGSGSVDLNDIRGPGSKGQSLVHFIACAMQRELVEEASVSYREIEWTEVLGYFRWLNMGGKPEYVGVTKLTLSSDELIGRDVRVVETPFVQRIVFDCTLDLAHLRSDPESLHALGRAFRQNVSMPLFMSLRALGMALRRDDALMQKLTAPTESREHL